MKILSALLPLPLALVATPLVAMPLAAMPLVATTSADDDLAQRIDAYFSHLSRLGFDGVLLVARDGEVILERAYGEADRETGRAMTTETAITIGSISKQFTAAAIMKLVELGKLTPQDPITRFFDDVPEDKRSTTLHHLLTHSAGLADGLGSDRDVSQNADEYLAMTLASELSSPPGETYRYSNVGYSLLAMVVERVSGQGYEEFLAEHIFGPAGMKRTGVRIPDYEPTDLAVGYSQNQRWGAVFDYALREDGLGWNMRGNGGIHSTAGDMYRWTTALMENTVLSEESREQLFTPFVPEGGGTFYGYGWSIENSPSGKPAVGHNGGNMVFFAHHQMYPEDGLMFYVASTNSAVTGEPLVQALRNFVWGREVLPLPELAQLERAQLEQFVGEYIQESGDPLRVSLVRGGLQLEAQEGEGRDILASGQSRRRRPMPPSGEGSRAVREAFYPTTASTFTSFQIGRRQPGSRLTFEADGAAMVLVIEAGNELCIATRGE